MNISSVVVYVLPEHENDVLHIIKNADFCEYCLHENGKIIVAIEGNDTEEEVEILQRIEHLPHVLEARMVFSYCEDTLGILRENTERTDVDLTMLNDPNISAKDIQYNGDLRKDLV